MNQITERERVQELRPLFNEDVQRILDGACETYMVDIRGFNVLFPRVTPSFEKRYEGCC